MIILLIILISIPAFIALFPAGFFYTHDSTFHIVRLMHFYEEISRGQFPVRWVESLAFGFGYPIFNYFYPLLYYVASLFHFLGLTFGESLKLEIVFFSICSAIALYYFLRCYFSKYPSLIGAIFFIYAPYRLLATYVSGSFGTILALFFVPLILLFGYKVAAEEKFKYIPFLSLALVGLVLSHNVSALMFAPVIVGYFCILRKNIYLLFLTMLLSLGMASFFLIPALFELSYVGLGDAIAVNYQDHWPTFQQLIYSPWGYGFSELGEDKDGMSFQIGFAQWAVIILTGLYITFAFLLKNKIKDLHLAFFFLTVILISIFLMLDVSNPVWSTLNLFQQIQFPWRILAVVIFCCSFLASWIVSKKGGLLLSIFLISLLLINNRNYLRTWEVKRYTDDFYKSEYFSYYGSTDIAWENRPVWVKNYPLPKTDQKIEPAEGINVNVLPLGDARYKAKVTSDNSRVLVLNYFYFPILGVKINGQDTEIKPSKMGKIEFSVPGGENEISLYLKGTNIERLSNLLSAFSFIVWAILFAYITIKVLKTFISQTPHNL